MDRSGRPPDRLHRAGFALGERLHRELQCSAARRAPERRDLLHPQVRRDDQPETHPDCRPILREARFALRAARAWLSVSPRPTASRCSTWARCRRGPCASDWPRSAAPPAGAVEQEKSACQASVRQGGGSGLRPDGSNQLRLAEWLRSPTVNWNPPVVPYPVGTVAVYGSLL